MTNMTENEAALDAGRQIANPHVLTAGSYYAITTADGVERIDLTDLHLDRPRRTVRHVVVNDVTSFADYWAKHAGPTSEVWADRRQLAIRGIIDAPGNNDPAWCSHSLTLQLRHSDSWAAWIKPDRTYMWQADFAEHIEDHLRDIIHPAGAEMLEVAQTLHAHTRVNFTSGYRLVDGQRQLQYVEETSGAAGPKGALSVPAEFTLGMPVFHGSNLGDELRARLRYRIKDRQLMLGYALNQATDVVDRAYQAVVNQLADHVLVPVFRGAANTLS